MGSVACTSSGEQEGGAEMSVEQRLMAALGGGGGGGTGVMKGPAPLGPALAAAPPGARGLAGLGALGAGAGGRGQAPGPAPRLDGGGAGVPGAATYG